MAVRHAHSFVQWLRCVSWLDVSWLSRSRPRLKKHHHPPQDVQLHEKFYSTWYMPDNPSKSCCNKQDCYPTETKYVGTSLFARRREDGAWIIVPPQKIEPQ